MGHPHIVCILCQRSDENTITGPLSIKDTVAAHQNCLLYSSGIYCRNSPEFDDLFGFSAEDVQEEFKRGRFLRCHKCRVKGATAGCEVKRCKKTFHYPCAIEHGAHTDENADDGKYTLYCKQHHQEREGVNGTISIPSSPEEALTPNKVSKVFCLVCMKKESIFLGSSNVVKVYCEKHDCSSLSNSNGNEAGPSHKSSDSSNSHTSKKRRLNCDGNPFIRRLAETPSRRSTRMRILDDSSDEEKEDSNIKVFAPLESDLDSSANSNITQEPHLTRIEKEMPVSSTSGNQPTLKEEEDDAAENELVIDSDTDSFSLLLPVTICVDSDGTADTFVKSPTTHCGSPHTPDDATALPSASVDDACSEPLNASCSPVSPAAPPPPPKHTSVPETPPTSSPTGPATSASPPPSPLPGLDSARFWKHCNEAKCTQAIFADFMREMTLISDKIQSDQASHKDYDLALKVMEASGKLEELVSTLAQDLSMRRAELKKASEAMKAVMSSLKR